MPSLDASAQLEVQVNVVREDLARERRAAVATVDDLPNGTPLVGMPVARDSGLSHQLVRDGTHEVLRAIAGIVHPCVRVAATAPLPHHLRPYKPLQNVHEWNECSEERAAKGARAFPDSHRRVAFVSGGRRVTRWHRRRWEQIWRVSGPYVIGRCEDTGEVAVAIEKSRRQADKTLTNRLDGRWRSADGHRPEARGCIVRGSARAVKLCHKQRHAAMGAYRFAIGAPLHDEVGEGATSVFDARGALCISQHPKQHGNATSLTD